MHIVEEHNGSIWSLTINRFPLNWVNPPMYLYIFITMVFASMLYFVAPAQIFLHRRFITLAQLSV